MIVILFNEEGELEQVLSDKFDEDVRVVNDTADADALTTKHGLKRVY